MNIRPLQVPQLIRTIAMASFGCGIIGCITPANTRFPTSWRAHPSSERQAWQQTDPLPDPGIGPPLDARPREFRIPRTIERRAAEQRILRGLPFMPENIPPLLPQGSRYPAAVN